MTWTDDVARFALDTETCPRCLSRSWQSEPAMREGVCRRCGADLRGEAGTALWTASEELVAVARRRQALVDALPDASDRSVTTGSTAVADGVVPDVAPERPQSTISLQSVLAVVGAALLAVAAIVFAFLNPDLTDFGTRTLVIAAVTALFLGGAWMLHRRGLGFSAEAVGALGIVFVGLDVWAFAQLTPTGVSRWFFGAAGLLVSGGALVVVGARMRMRSWLWSGLVAVAVVPALLGCGIQQQFFPQDMGWSVAWGLVGVVLAGAGLLELVRPLARRTGSELLAERISLTTVQGLGVLAAGALASLATLSDLIDGAPAPLLRLSAIVAALAVGALLSTRSFARTGWSVVGGLLTSGALIAAALAVPVPGPWLLALVAAAAALPLIAAAGLRGRMGTIRRTAFTTSALQVALMIAVGTVLLLGSRGMLALAGTWAGHGAPLDADVALDVLGGVIALFVIAVGFGALPRHVGGRSTAPELELLTRWTLVPVAAGLPIAFPWAPGFTIGCALTVSLAASLTLLAPRIRRQQLAFRAPIAAVAYGAILEAVLFSWTDAATTAIAGAVSVATLAVAARTAPARIRPLHTATGFGYALVAGAAALSLTGLGALPVLCLLTSAAALAAIATTLGARLPTGSWYAVLGVASAPFGLSILSVLIERSGWTALSTGVMLLLAVAILLTRRPGAGLGLRAMAGALLVPMLSVVIVCLAAELLPMSGSPYALIVIAVLVACVLPTTGLLRAGLVRAGLPGGTADVVRLAIEASSLVTGAIAVLLALVRVAAGVDIALVVLLVLGTGSAATALRMRRRYGWWAASAAWTGALWCAWSLVGMTVVEPYLLPPGIAATTVGAALVARDRAAVRPAVALFGAGLGIALLPSLVLLAITGNGTGTSLAAEPVLWRAGLLLLAAAALLGLAAVIPRRAATATRLEPLRVPLLAGAIAAAAAGAIEGVRLGAGIDPLPLAGIHPMFQVLGVAVIAAAIAVSAARAIGGTGSLHRWPFAPALVYLVLGPMAAIRPDAASIWTLWALELLLLAAMVVTVTRARERVVRFPPVWFQWGLAWIVAVVAWSQREILRVEGFALPLGLALVVAGVLALSRGVQADDRRGLDAWPLGFPGSWRTLGPGIVATLLPSIMATFTDPQTWRAILVIALALIAVLVGARATLGAPFLLGIAALPLEILVVFLVRLGTATIDPLLWWITLATAGIVLLVIAAGWERRTGSDASLTARIRDLR